MMTDTIHKILTRFIESITATYRNIVTITVESLQRLSRRRDSNDIITTGCRNIIICSHTLSISIGSVTINRLPELKRKFITFKDIYRK